ncbi:MAG: hypothetical protein GTO18_19680 [Anaerolineales bacterium]|nr:hypothetical protein [Anaerolineales bacterium]
MPGTESTEVVNIIQGFSVSALAAMLTILWLKMLLEWITEFSQRYKKRIEDS